MNTPMVTICIPTFNNAGTLADTLTSLRNQTYKNLKIKIFDNASTDDSVSVAESFANRFNSFEIHKSSINLGGEGNFTRCIQNAEGEYTAIFHSDDTYSTDCIENHIRFLQNYDCGASFSGAFIIDQNGAKITKRFIPKELKNYEEHILDFNELWNLVIKYGNFITCPSVVAKSSIYKDYIRIWNGSEFKTSADLDVWLRIARHSKIGFINKELINYRSSEYSYSYNLIRRRVDTHDLFLVLNHHNTKECSQFDFLKFKDNGLIFFNVMKNKENSNFTYHSDISVANVFKTATHSTWHLKYFLLSFVIHLIWKIRGR